MSRALVLVVMLAACGGEIGGGGVSLAIEAPAPGAEVVRDDVSGLGELAAAVPVQLAIGGMPARVALSIGDRALGDAAADGSATVFVGVAGPVTLTATAFDEAGAALATAQVEITVVDPTVADCHGWLDLYGVGYTVGPTRPGVKDPVTAMMPINGMAFRSGGAARTTMYADCSLIKSLAYASSMLRARGVVEITDLGVYNYRCINNDGTPPNCTIGLSEHSFGNAIDLASFKDAAGETYVVKTDWVIDPNSEETCMAPTEPGKDRFLHEAICELKAAKTWSIVLTPNYNTLHRDHFHVDLTAGSDFIERTRVDEGDAAHAAALDH